MAASVGRGRGSRWSEARRSFFKNLALSLGALSLSLVRVVELHTWALPLVFVAIVLLVTWMGEVLVPFQRRALTSLVVLAQVVLYWDRLGPEVLVGLLVALCVWWAPFWAWWNDAREGLGKNPWFGQDVKRLSRAYWRLRGMVHRVHPSEPRKRRTRSE